MCGGSSRCWSRLWCLALLLSALATPSVSAQEPPTSPPPSVTPSSTDSPQISDSPSLEQLLTELENEANAQAEDLKKLLEQLAGSQTEVNELSILLGLSEERLKSLQEAMMNERDQSRQALALAIEKGARAEKYRDRWRTGAIGAGLVALAGWVAFAASMTF